MKQAEVTKHFNKIAKDYDTYKKNHFYYTNLVKYELGKRILKGARILDYGCGTGEILNFLSPSYGIGFDPSREMIKIAKKKFLGKKSLTFTDKAGEIKGNFDYIVSVDTIEHFPSPTDELKKIRKFMDKSTKFIISYGNPRWNWLISILEKIKPKTPEGPHNRISQKEVIMAARKAGLKLSKPVPFWLIDIFIFTAYEETPLKQQQVGV